ncbi:MAG: AMP-binding protein, partial [bacterium]|nr:AMP-binding protein [bacterium]
MLFHNIMDETSSAYFEQMALVVSGKIERDLLENTMNGIIEKYDILRTVFTYKKTKKPRQVLLKKRKINVPFEDISTLNEEGQTEFIEGFKKADRQKGFALSKGPLIRVSLLKCREDSYRLIWSYHHILMDGWCFGILFKDFMEIYTRLEKKQKENKYTPQKETLPKIPGILPAAPYSRFIKWLERQNKQKAMGFWEKYLDGYDQQVSIPRPEKENRDEDYREGKLESVITERLARELKKLALEKHATVGTFFQTLWGILLQKYNNTVDAVFGVVVSGRPPEIPGIDEMVGLFINTVPVRVNAAKYGTFSSLLTAVQRHAVESKTYDYLPLPEIQAHSFLKSGLVDHILAFENVPLQNNIRETAGNGAAAFAITGMNAYEQTDYGFNVIAAPAGDTLCIRLLYNAMKYDPGFIENITGHLQEIIKQVVANPDIDVQHITIITETEKRLLLRDFNRTNREYPKEKTIHEIFAGQVGKTPDNAAVVGRSIWKNPRPGPWENTGKDTGKNTEKNTGNPAAKAAHLLTYKALEQKSDHLAARLKDKGLLPGQIVGILVEHSLEMITGILAVLKAGGAFLPIDPVYPRARIDFMLKDSGANLLLTST